MECNISSATDQSANDSFCNDNVGNRNSIACGNKGCVDQTADGGSVVESGNEGSSVFDTNYQRSVHREAALNKVRLKRKERCFEKKEHEEMNILSAKLARSGPPVGPTEEEMVLSVRGDGRLRWKIGTWISGSYKINVQCVAMINHEPMLGSLSLKQETQCSTFV